MDWQSADGVARILVGDCLQRLRDLPDCSVQCCVTSPPYFGLRAYLPDGHESKHLEKGSERTLSDYVSGMVEVFREVRRVLRNDGVLWLNLGDSYVAGKQLGGVPWRVAFALQDDGWVLRQDVIWHKPSPMPESVTDRCTKAHEYVFLLTKSERYFYDADAVREPLSEATRNDPRMKDMGRTYGGKGRGAYGESGKANGSMQAWTLNPAGRNRRSVWKVSTKPYKGAHFATMPPDLVEPCILAGTSESGCCESCGAPLVRQTSKTKLKRERPNAYTKRSGEDGTGNSCANDVAGVAVETTGWLPSCDCNAGVIPCLVLDPFGGSGTTVAVAAKLGRRGVCCELNPEYIKLAIERITPNLPSSKHPLLKG